MTRHQCTLACLLSLTPALSVGSTQSFSGCSSTQTRAAQAAVSSRCAEVVRHGQQRRAGRCGVRILRAPALQPGGPARPAGPASARVGALDAAEAGRIRGVAPGHAGAPPAAAGGAGIMPSSGIGAAGAAGSAAIELGAEGSAPGGQHNGQAQAEAEGDGMQAQPGAHGRQPSGSGVEEQAGPVAPPTAMGLDQRAPTIGGGKKRKKARRGSAQGRGTQGWQQMPG